MGFTKKISSDKALSKPIAQLPLRKKKKNSTWQDRTDLDESHKETERLAENPQNNKLEVKWSEEG
jgi:hypothetical protein